MAGWSTVRGAPVVLMCRNGTAQLALEREKEGADKALYAVDRKCSRRRNKEKSSLAHARRSSKLQRAKLARSCGEERRREGVIQARREDLAQLAPEMVRREGESREKGERLGPGAGGAGRRWREVVNRPHSLPHQEWQ